jgi:hypothetical protein
MKIIFICGSLEPGRDGVGDYTRCLAGALVGQGHQVAAIALNDGYTTTQMSGKQQCGNNKFAVLRLPASWSDSMRFGFAKSWIDAFDPEWLSLQFVPFSFHPKGLSFGLSKKLLKLGTNRLWHLMFHELWVGMDVEASKMQKWWGLLQRRLIQDLVISLKPVLVHTQTRLYQLQLAKLGVTANHLPLFGNIPRVKQQTGKYKGQHRAEVTKDVSLVAFAYLHPNAPIEQLAKEAANYSTKRGVPVTLTLVGRSGKEQERWNVAWRNAGLKIKVLGEQPAEYISEVLDNATVGVCTTPMALIEKSGAAAAMQEHELPVLCVSPPWVPSGIEHIGPPPGVVEYKPGNFNACLSSCWLSSFYPTRTADISMQLADSLQNQSIKWLA